MSRDKGKGKAKAVDRTSPSESAPLLGSSSRSYLAADIDADDLPTAVHTTRASRASRIRSIAFTCLIVLASLLVAGILFIVLLAASYRPSPSELLTLPRTAFAYSSPDSISVLNITDEGILLNITTRCGIDADRALGVKQFSNIEDKQAAAEKGERGIGAGWWESLRRWTAYKALQSLDQPSVSVSSPQVIQVYPQHSAAPPLLSLRILDELQIPLVWDIPLQAPDSEPSWLQPITFTALAKPLASTADLLSFIQHGWVEGLVRTQVSVDVVQVKPSEKAWWTKYAQVEKEDLSLEITLPIPRLPRLPDPGHPLNLSELVTLQHYAFDTSQSPQSLKINAVATIPNFVPDLNTTLHFGLPFSIALPAALDDFGGTDNTMAEVITEPIRLGGQAKDIELKIGGVITANLSFGDHLTSLKSLENGTSSPLSLFLQNYLHGRDNPILVRGLGSLPSFAPSSTVQPPAWLLSSLPSLSVPLTFPGPRPPPKIIESVTIDHMRISENKGKMKASGTVIAQVELPKDMQDVEVDVVEVRPDVLVFDGPAPEVHDGDDDDGGDPPAKAFGHIHPDEFLASTTSPSGDPRFPHRLIVSAPLSNVDLDILSGRDSVLSDFVSKVVFKGGAQAGVKGVASVRVKITGVNGTVRLDNLPVRGEFWVGKQRGLF